MKDSFLATTLSLLCLFPSCDWPHAAPLDGPQNSWRDARYDSAGFPIYGYLNGSPVYAYCNGSPVYSRSAIRRGDRVPQHQAAPTYRGQATYPQGVKRGPEIHGRHAAPAR